MFLNSKHDQNKVNDSLDTKKKSSAARALSELRRQKFTSPMAKKEKQIVFDQNPVNSVVWLKLKKDYKLIKFIGEGSFGQVKLGQCRKTKRMVAIKLIKDFADCEYNCIKVAREI